MSEDSNTSTKFEEAFQILAQLVNQLSPEDRVKLREQLGAYTHDLKNTVGLITGANMLIKRLPAQQEFDTGTLEMTELITIAANRIDELIMLMVENLNNEIKDQ
jgi:hypothetical protein